MAWIATGDCAAAGQFGVFVGLLSGLFVDLLIIGLIKIARDYRPRPRDGVPRLPRTERERERAERERRREEQPVAIRSLLVTLPWLLVIVWSVCATYVGSIWMSCYATHLAAAAAIAIAPMLALVLWTAANKVGTGGVRS
jgi:hypothetical protein